MKIATKIFAVILIILIGYLLGSFFPVSGFMKQESIVGNAGLDVTVLKPDKTPLINTEVDIATTPGAPKTGGIMNTDNSGVARFRVKPGTYYVFFNANNFPAGLEQHEMPQIVLEENKTVTLTINLFPKENN